MLNHELAPSHTLPPVVHCLSIAALAILILFQLFSQETKSYFKMEAIFGSKLVEGTNVVDTASMFGDGIELIGIYFSAHWCPPCRGFTPTLADFYKAVNANGKRLEIVFVSHDRDENSFNSYFGEMPWLAIPFDNDDDKQKLIGEHKVSGIPKLVFIGKDGTPKIDDGRSKVMGDTKGANFPWN